MSDNKIIQDDVKKEGEKSSKENSSAKNYSDSSNVEVNEKRIEDCIGQSLDQLANGFTESARRWEMIVYPSLLAFVILAAYGFFLIYSLTKDVHYVVEDMHKITASMERVVVNMDAISKNMVVMTQTVDSQSGTMKEMVYHIRGMNMSMNQMRQDMSIMNNSVSRPMSFMNNFMPW